MSQILILFFLAIHLRIYASDIAMVSLVVGSDYNKAVQKGVENKKLYCKKHGYDFICIEKSLDISRPIPWSKVLLLRKILKNANYKWVFWSDADSLIMNLGVKLEDFLDDDYNLIIAKDFNGINTGQFFLKNCPWSMQLLSDMYAHIECIYHPWWEQQALITEIEQHPELSRNIKIVSQKLFNSYPSETSSAHPHAIYQKGDFIIHFAGVKHLGYLSTFLDNYNEEVIDCPEYANIDLYQKEAGFILSPMHSNINEGYMTESQKKQFVEWLQLHPSIKRIAEIGLNAGHSAENFFQNCPDLEEFISFDIQEHAYSKVAVEFFKKKYKDRFIFIPGDSTVTVPNFTKNMPNTKYDLIYIDGNHSYENAIQDIMNCRELANENTVLWIDDYNGSSIRQAVHECQRRGIISIFNIHCSSDPYGARAWVEACYKGI
jgi:predicted O-methyltransferase YrrM